MACRTVRSQAAASSAGAAYFPSRIAFSTSRRRAFPSASDATDFVT